MKWLVFILSFLFLLTSAGAVPVITDEFYLSNGELYDSDAVAVSSILPNTLRLVLAEGEQSELRADVVPKGATERELWWILPDNEGRIEIYPNGEKCTVVGIEEGEERIKLHAASGASASVLVEVKKTPEIRMRSFDYEGEVKRPAYFTDTVMRLIVRILITVGAIMVFVAVLITVKRRIERAKDEK